MQAQQPKVDIKKVQQPAKTLAEQRQMITPQYPEEQWSNSDSELSLHSSNQEELVEMNQKSESKILNQNIEQSEKSTQKSQSEIGQNKLQNKSIDSQKIERQKILNEKEIQYKSFVHTIDQKFSLLLLRMIRNKFINICQIAGLKNKGHIDFFSKGNKATIRTTDKKTADQAICKLSDFIDDLNVLKLQIRPELAHKIQNFRRVRQQFKARKIVIFGMQGSNKARGLYIGGMLKYSDLKKIQSELQSYRIVNFFMRMYRNKRSYKIILDQIFKTQFMMKQMLQFNSINIMEVDKNNKQKNLKIYMNTLSKFDISPSQYQQFIFKNIKKYFVICYLLQSQKYFQKLSVPEEPHIIFRFVKEHNEKRLNLTYLIIICHKDIFFSKSKLIQTEIEKVGENIKGIRFFNNLYPNFHHFSFDSEIYYVLKFPKMYPYSMIVHAKSKEGKKYYWRQTFNMFKKLQQIYQEKQLLD